MAVGAVSVLKCSADNGLAMGGRQILPVIGGNNCLFKRKTPAAQGRTGALSCLFPAIRYSY